MRSIIAIAALAAGCGSEPWSDSNARMAREAASKEDDRLDWCSRTVAENDFCDGERREAVAGWVHVGQREPVAMVAGSYAHPRWIGPVLESTVQMDRSVFHRWHFEDLYGCGRLDIETRNGIVWLVSE